jgi:tetratricopeptide (TPR) repeat protein
VYTGPVVGSSRLIPGWGWYVPQSYRGYRPSFYAPPVAMEPRLGLQYNYPYAWQMGITMPADASPLVTPSLGPFEGVVRSQERSLRLNSVAARSGVALLRKGKYRDAGLLLARAYRDSDDPINPLLLAEALFGLGKYQHAELVLRKALESDGALDVLPEDVAGHFPSAKVFEERLADLVKSGKHQLLSAYMSLFAADGSSGIAGLLALMKTDKQAGKLYRHYLDRVFGPEEEAGEAPAEGKAQ